MNGKLGKRRPRIDPRTFRLTRYLPSLAPPPPPLSMNWTHQASWPMMLNDSIGDCTCAASGHMIEEWTRLNCPVFTPPDSAILKAYEDVSGYNPADPNSDNGAVMLDVLKYWRKTGIAGHKILAYAAISTRPRPPLTAAFLKMQIMDSVYLFGNCYLGIQLPLSAQDQINAGQPWSVNATVRTPGHEPGSWGGHCVPIVDYDANGLTVVTWGALQRMTWYFLQVYGDEAYAVLSNDWLNTRQISPGKFNLAQLKADLAAL